MILNHLALGVTEIPLTLEMFEKYFGLRRVANSAGNDNMAFLNDDAGTLLSIFRAPDAKYPEIFRVGFMRDTAEQVSEVHEQLKTDGFALEAIRQEFGRRTFCFKAPGGFTVEVSAFVSEQTAAGTRPEAE